MYKPELLYQDEVVRYHARCIRAYCKEHRCATCPLSDQGSCRLLSNSPCEWKEIGKEEG